MPDPRPVNSIVLEPGTGQVAFRETFFDKRTRPPADLRIDLVGEVAAADARAPTTWRPSSSSPGSSCSSWRPPRSTCGTTPPTNINTFGGTAGSVHVEAQDDEVRIAQRRRHDLPRRSLRARRGRGARWSPCTSPSSQFLYWGLTTASPWMESYDYRYTTTSLNNRTATALGRRLVEAGHRPHRSRRAQLARHRRRREGYMLVRWVLADGPPHPTCELVPVGEAASRV